MCHIKKHQALKMRKIKWILAASCKTNTYFSSFSKLWVRLKITSVSCVGAGGATGSFSGGGGAGTIVQKRENHFKNI